MNDYWGARVLLLSKRGAEKGGGGGCVFVCEGVCLCVEGEGLGGVYQIQQLTNLLFSQDLYKKKQNDD